MPFLNVLTRVSRYAFEIIRQVSLSFIVSTHGLCNINR